MNRIILTGKSIIFFILLLCSISSKTIHPQCYILTTQEHKDIMWREYGVIVEDRQGNFASYDDCVAYLNSAIDFDPIQRARHYCDCDQPVQTDSYYIQEQTDKPLVEDHQTQLDKIRAIEEKELMLKKLVDQKKFTEDKKELTGKLKQNKALDQLKTTSDLSVKGQQNVNNNQTDDDRKVSESAFTEGKITPNNAGTSNNNIPVSPPTPIDHQKNLFNFMDLETKKVQTKINEVQKEKTQINEKNLELKIKISDQRLNIEELKLDKMEAKEEAKVEEIDSLLLLATQMLEESIELNEKATQELEEKDKLVKENEALLNKYQDTYTRSIEHPEESEQLLKELQKGKK